VVLRAVEREDLRWIWVLRNDETVESLAYGPPTPRSMAESEAWLEALQAERDSWMFVVDVDGEAVGLAYLRDVDPVSRRAEIGIALNAGTLGKGYGTDTMRVLLRHAFDDLNLHRITVDMLATNERAYRMCRTCGFAEEGRLREYEWSGGRYVDSILMGVLREGWEAVEAARDGPGAQDTLR
jgi:RimJ/RimL family protein N-acetyltransferase